MLKGAILSIRLLFALPLHVQRGGEELLLEQSDFVQFSRPQPFLVLRRMRTFRVGSRHTKSIHHKKARASQGGFLVMILISRGHISSSTTG